MVCRFIAHDLMAMGTPMKCTIGLGLVVVCFALSGCRQANRGEPQNVTLVGDNFITATVSARLASEEYPRLAAKICGDRAKCMVGIWRDDNPESLPFSDSDLARLSFAYTRNAETDFVALAWDCKEFRLPEDGICLPNVK